MFKSPKVLTLLLLSLFVFSWGSSADCNGLLSRLFKSSKVRVDSQKISAEYNSAKLRFQHSSIANAETDLANLNNPTIETQVASLLAFLDVFVSPQGWSYRELLDALGGLKVVRDSSNQGWTFKDNGIVIKLGLSLTFPKPDLSNRNALYGALWGLAQGLHTRRFLQSFWPLRRTLCASPGAYAFAMNQSCEGIKYSDARNSLNPFDFIRRTRLSLEASENALSNLYKITLERAPEAAPTLPDGRPPRLISAVDLSKVLIPLATGAAGDYLLQYLGLGKLVEMFNINMTESGLVAGGMIALLSYPGLLSTRFTRNLVDGRSPEQLEVIGRRLGIHWIVSNLTRATIVCGVIASAACSIYIVNRLSELATDFKGHVQGVVTNIQTRGKTHIENFDIYLVQEAACRQAFLKFEIGKLEGRSNLTPDEIANLARYTSELKESVRRYGSPDPDSDICEN